ncbi:MAG: hypothetical protein HY521_06495 [Proteobacteria bacterium]|nr:hypothetical protein [Pseudomonadota bacterium]
MAEVIPLTHIFIDHSNLWGGARLASRIKHPAVPDAQARISVRGLDTILGGRRLGVSTKIVSGGVPPGMEGLWSEYSKAGYDTQRLFRDTQWKERGVDHAIIGHIWRLASLHRDSSIILVLASGDGKRNEFGTSFLEVLDEILRHRSRYPNWQVRLASFDWEYPSEGPYRPPTNGKMRRLVTEAPNGSFINLMDHYGKIVYHEVYRHAHASTGSA